MYACATTCAIYENIRGYQTTQIFIIAQMSVMSVLWCFININTDVSVFSGLLLWIKDISWRWILPITLLQREASFTTCAEKLGSYKTSAVFSCPLVVKAKNLQNSVQNTDIPITQLVLHEGKRPDTWITLFPTNENGLLDKSKLKLRCKCLLRFTVISMGIVIPCSS